MALLLETDTGLAEAWLATVGTPARAEETAWITHMIRALIRGR